MVDNIINKILMLSIKENTDYSFFTIDEMIRKIIRRYFISSIVVLAIGIVLSIFTLDISPVVFALVVAILLFYQFIKLGRDCISGKLLKVTGVYFDDKSTGTLIERDYVTIMLEDQSLIRVLYNKKNTIEPNNEVVVYFYEDALRKDKDDTFIISTCVHLGVSRSISNISVNDTDLEDEE